MVNKKGRIRLTKKARKSKNQDALDKRVPGSFGSRS